MEDMHKTAMELQLKLLNDRMKETSATANRFLTQFHFGGMIAVIALLNVDIVLVGKPTELSIVYIQLLLGISVVLLGLSWLYFTTVIKHYQNFRKSHRKLKYKYELTLQAMLYNASSYEYAEFLEKGVDSIKSPESMPFPSSDKDVTFIEVADYLLEHHAVRYIALNIDSGKSYVYIAMSLVVLTLAIRLAGLILNLS